MNKEVFRHDEFLPKAGISRETLAEWLKWKIIRPAGYADDKSPLFSGEALERAAHIRKLKDQFAGYESIIEFRNARWFEEQYFDLLRELSLGFCIVDEPKLKGLMPFLPVLTSTTGYFRFHGRNRSWFREPVDIRYDYLYSEKELRGFVKPIMDIASRASGDTFVFFNNCHSGKAARNALMMIELLKERPVCDPAAQAALHN